MERDSNSLRSPDFRRRLGYYLVGLAIGLLILGSITSARKMAADLREREMRERMQKSGGEVAPPSGAGSEAGSGAGGGPSGAMAPGNGR